MNKFAKDLKKIRLSSGLSQKQVSTKLGYSTPQFISNWERGVSHPPVRSLRKLAAIYKVPNQSLFEALLRNEISKFEERFRREFETSQAG